MKQTEQEIYDRFEQTAYAAAKDGQSFDRFADRNHIPDCYRLRYAEIRQQYQAEQAQEAKPSQMDVLAKEVAAAMGVAPDEWIDDSMP